MTLLDGLSTVLWADTAFKAACPGGIAAVQLPERVTLPAATALIVSSLSDPTFESSGLQKVRVQFDCYALTYGEASDARNALVDVLNGYIGHLADGTDLQNADQIQAIDFFEDDSRQFRCMVEFYLYFDVSS